MSSSRDDISVTGKHLAVPNAETATLVQHDDDKIEPADEKNGDKVDDKPSCRYCIAEKLFAEKGADEKIVYCQCAKEKIADSKADESNSAELQAVDSNEEVEELDRITFRRVRYEDPERGHKKSESGLFGVAEYQQPKCTGDSSNYIHNSAVRKVCKYGIIPALAFILIFGVVSIIKLMSIDSFTYENQKAIKVLAKNNGFAISNLNSEYHARTTTYNAFMDQNTAALKEEILNLTSTITEGVVPAAQVSASLEAATSVADKMQVLKNMIVAVSPEKFFELEPKVLVTLLQVITDRFKALDVEMAKYSEFLKVMGKKIKATQETIYFKRSFKIANATATSNTGDLPTIFEFSNSVFQAAIQKYAPLLLTPANIPTPMTDILSGSLTLTAGINLSSLQTNTILICPTTYYFTYIPSIGLLGNATYHDGICTSYPFTTAEKLGMGVSDKGWTWFDQEWPIIDVNNEDLRLGNFTYGERDVGDVKWVVDNRPAASKARLGSSPAWI